MAQKENNSVTWAIWAIVVLIVVFFLSYYLFQGWGTIEYNGLTFETVKEGDLIFYKYAYFFQDDEGQVYKNNVYLRQDPRRNTVPKEGEFVYPKGKFVYISINATGIRQCEDSVIAVSSLSSFYSNNLLMVRGGTPSLEEAAGNLTKHITCENSPSNAVILIQEGNETRIRQTAPLCYEVSINNCEILPAVEKVIVESIIDAREAE